MTRLIERVASRCITDLLERKQKISPEKIQNFMNCLEGVDFIKNPRFELYDVIGAYDVGLPRIRLVYDYLGEDLIGIPTERLGNNRWNISKIHENVETIFSRIEHETGIPFSNIWSESISSEKIGFDKLKCHGNAMLDVDTYSSDPYRRPDEYILKVFFEQDSQRARSQRS